MKKILLIASILIFSLSNLFAVTVSDEGVNGVDRYAIFIGANDGGKGREKLLYAGSDAISFKNAMSEIGGVSETNSIILIDPTKENIDKALQKISDSINAKSGQTKRSEFIFYYSGHSDENALLLGNSKYDYSKLKAAITEVPSDIHVVILDSCYSGNFIRTKGGQKRKPFLIDDSSVVTGHAYLSSSSDNESSQESDEIESSYFTNAMITGLRGAADTSGDNKVTLNELYSYAFSDTLSKTEASKAGPQHPNYNITLVGSGDLILSDLSIADSMLSLSKDAKGRFIIRDANDKLISEINKTPGQPIFIALPVGQYSALIIDEYSTKQGTFLLEKDQIFVLDQNSLTSIKRKSNRLRGNSDDKDTLDNIKDSLPDLADDDTLDLEGITESNRKILVEKQPLSENSNKETVIKVEVHEDTPDFEADFSQFYGVDVAFVPGVSFINPNADILNFSIGILGTSPKNVYGLNAANLFNIASGRIIGAQFAGLFNIATDSVYGAQISGLYNINKNTTGTQISGLFNTSGNVKGTQISGLFNVAKDLEGMQITSLMNVARSVKGIQISSLLNVADKIDGPQIGIINVARENNGIALGLINFIGNGLFDLGISINTNRMFEFRFQNGAKGLYNVMGILYELDDDGAFIYDTPVVYYGLGTHMDFILTSLEFEFLMKFYCFDKDYHQDLYNKIENLPADKILKEFTVPCFRINWNIIDLDFASLFISTSFDFYNDGENDLAHNMFDNNWEIETDNGWVAPSFSFGGKFRI